MTLLWTSEDLIHTHVPAVRCSSPHEYGKCGKLRLKYQISHNKDEAGCRSNLKHIRVSQELKVVEAVWVVWVVWVWSWFTASPTTRLLVKEDDQRTNP